MIYITIITYNERHHHTVLESGAGSLVLATLRLYWQCIFNLTLHLNIRLFVQCIANRLVIDGQYRLIRLRYQLHQEKPPEKVTWTTRAKVQN